MGSKKTTTTHQEVTPTNPDWVTNPIKNFTGQIDALGSKDPQSFVAGSNTLLDKATAGAGQLATPTQFGQASDLYAGLGGANVHGQSLLDNLHSYMDPFTNDVVNTTLAGYDQNAGRTRQQQGLDINNDATFGGSGGSILRAMTEGQLGLGRAQTEAGLRSSAFNTGAQFSNMDAQRRQDASLANLQAKLGAAGGLASLGATQGADTRANISAQASAGDIQRQIEQQQKAAPLSLMGTQAGLLGSMPYQMFNGQITDGTQTTKSSGLGPALGALGSLAGGLGALGLAPFTGGLSLGALGGASGMGNMIMSSGIASDRRLKRDIVKLGERPDGLGVYLYRYLWSPVRFIGVMAQEVLRVKPEAVVTMPNGYLAVDYGKL